MTILPGFQALCALLSHYFCLCTSLLLCLANEKNPRPSKKLTKSIYCFSRNSHTFLKNMVAQNHYIAIGMKSLGLAFRR
jgi:hypothetical protein